MQTSSSTRATNAHAVVSMRTVALALRANGFVPMGYSSKAGFKGYAIEAIRAHVPVANGEVAESIIGYRVYFEQQGRPISEQLLRTRLTSYAAALKAADIDAIVAENAHGLASYVLVRCPAPQPA